MILEAVPRPPGLLPFSHLGLQLVLGQLAHPAQNFDLDVLPAENTPLPDSHMGTPLLM